MQEYVKSISPGVEFSIVVLVAFGYFIVGSILSLLLPHSTGMPITQSHLFFLMIYEPIVVFILWKFLSLRGWNLKQIGFSPDLYDSMVGVGLFVITYLVNFFVLIIFVPFSQGIYDQVTNMVEPNLGLSTVLAVSVINPIFEEVFVCGYIVTALKKFRSVTFAINVSIAIRLAYHLYQGVIGVISIVPLGFLFTYWFARTGRIWPLIVAHGIFDYFGLVAYVK